MNPKKIYIEPQAHILVLQSEAIICVSQPNDPNGIEQGIVIPDSNFGLL